jgi:hypothetical protein
MVMRPLQRSSFGTLLTADTDDLVTTIERVQNHVVAELVGCANDTHLHGLSPFLGLIL